jgi:phage I-like protein
VDAAHLLDRSARLMSRRGRVPNVALMNAAKRRTGVTSLSIVLSGDEPPSEFRLFTAGKVETTKGEFIFDEAAAQAVMAEYQKHGIDLMVDYDHASLASLSLDPATAGKAAGWFCLEVRAGELWAVNVRWTEPAAQALRAKEWRFMSPAFSTDEEGRITSVMNVAITNLPATRNLDPLMAASAAGKSMLDASLISKALEAIAAGDEAGAMDILKSIVAAAAGGGEEKPAEEKPAEDTPTAAAEGAPVEEEEKPEEVMAASARLMRLSGKTSIVDAIAEVEVWRTSHLKLETETQKLAAERKVLEDAERRKLCVELVSLAGRAPATVWADDKSSAPKAYLAAMPIADLRAMHADAIKASGGKPSAVKPPVVAADSHGLSARELAMCSEMKIDPKDYAARKAATTKKAG